MIGSAAKEGQRLEDIEVKDIKPNPRQPRRRFDEDAIQEMARSIEAFGIVQPVIVRPVGTEYELVAGERRWRAAKEAGFETIPAVIRESTETDSLEMALIENLHRSDLNGIEEATAYQQLLEDFGITHEELSRRVGKSRTAITNTIRLLQLPALIQQAVMEERISTGHARALLGLQEKQEEQIRLLERIIKSGLSVRETEEAVRSRSEEDAGGTSSREPVPEEVEEIAVRLSEVLDARVKVSAGKRSGRLVIEFRDAGDLRRIFNRISPEGSGVGEEPASAATGESHHWE